MQTISSNVLKTLALAAALLVPTAAGAAAKTYQVTGPVLEVNADNVVVQKGKEKWQVEREAATKASGGDLKVGDKVTIEYRMIATSIENKGGGKAADQAEKAADKAEKKADKAEKKADKAGAK